MVSHHPHILKNDDVIEIADVQIRYRNHKAIDGPSFDRTMIIQASAWKAMHQPNPLAPMRWRRPKGAPLPAGAHLGLIRVFNGTQPSKKLNCPGAAYLRYTGKQVA